MKKLVYLLMALCLLVTLVPAAVSGHTVGDPQVVELTAGQYMDIGDVLVWNGGTNLYVKFVSTGDCLLETHVHVGTSLADFPLTKQGNPIPGHFQYSDPHGCVNAYTYTIPLGTWAPGTTLLIAAHASTGVAETMWVYSDATESFTANSGPGTDGLCIGPSPRSGPATLAWQHSAWISNVNPQFTYGTWVWESEYAFNPICGDVVDFNKTFTVPGYPNGGTLWVTADNGYEAYLNTGFLGSDGLSGDWRNSNLTESFVTTAMAAWSSVESYDLTDWLVSGGNTFHFATANEYFNTDDDHGSAGTTSSNPGGLIYEAEINYYADGETAWGQGPEFGGKNWAMYFTYTVQPAVICADFSTVETGASVEGLGTVAPYLNIDAIGTAVKVVEGAAPSVYGAPNTACGETPITNGGIDPDGGFSDDVTNNAQQAHFYTFIFAPEVTVSDLSLHMLDFGDWNPTAKGHHIATMKAYAAGDTLVDQMTLEYNSQAAGNPRWSDHGDLLCGTGDAVDALSGEPGNWTWHVSGTGIVKVELFFGEGFDPNIGFDTLCFTIE